MNERPEAVDMRLPGESFCADCPDHEACATGMPCWQVRRIARVWPRSTPGPSTGTPEPSQAASEWIATSHTPPSLDQPVRREAWFDGYRAAREDACLDVCSGEVARLWEVVELVRVGVSEMLAAMCPDPKCGHGECDAYATVIAWLREVVHPSDGPAPDEATR